MNNVGGPQQRRQLRPNLEDRARVHHECDPRDCGDAGVAEYALELEAALQHIIALPQNGAWLKRDGVIQEIAAAAIRGGPLPAKGGETRG